MYKFGIRVPKDIREALAFDKVNMNAVWKEAIKK